MNVRLAGVLIVMAAAAPAWAGPKAAAARELAEALSRKGAKEVAEHGVEAFARRVEAAAVRHGDDVFHAVKAVGPKALPLIEGAGVHGGRAAALLGRHGEAAAVWVVGRPSAMTLVARHGDDAAAALVKHPGIAEGLVEKAGAPAVAALARLGPQSGRRLAMLAEEAAPLAANPKVLDVLARYGDAGMAFVWKHKGALAVSGTLAAFLADPGPFISGAKDITRTVGETAVRPLAEAPGKVLEAAVTGAAPEVARSTNWTLVVLGGMGVGGLLVWGHSRRHRPPPVTAA